MESYEHQSINVAKVMNSIKEFGSLLLNLPYMMNVASGEQTYIENASQDFFHILELTPEIIMQNSENYLSALSQLRRDRRRRKNELEAVQCVQQWAEKQKDLAKSLQQLYNRMDTILKNQPTLFYSCKTGEFLQQGEHVVRAQNDAEQPPEPFNVRKELGNCVYQHNCDNCFFKCYGEVNCRRELMKWLQQQENQQKDYMGSWVVQG